MKKKTLALILALVLVFGAAVGGTIAYLTDSTDPVTNTFSVGKVAIDLTETKPVKQTAKMVPGDTIEKDPKVEVKANSEACWLFVAVTEGNGLSTFIDYTVDTTVWTKLGGYDNVWYKSVSADDAKTGDTYNVLTDNQVTVKTSVTMADMNGVTADTQPTLTFNAYACQSANVNDPTTALSYAPDVFQALCNPVTP